MEHSESSFESGVNPAAAEPENTNAEQANEHVDGQHVSGESADIVSSLHLSPRVAEILRARVKDRARLIEQRLARVEGENTGGKPIQQLDSLTRQRVILASMSKRRRR
jgi:hypothetical protein